MMALMAVAGISVIQYDRSAVHVRLLDLSLLLACY
jgi:hypothetical protein